jgi:hypothetical protein
MPVSMRGIGSIGGETSARAKLNAINGSIKTAILPLLILAFDKQSCGVRD